MPETTPKPKPEWDELMRKVDIGKQAPDRLIVQWVFNNAGNEPVEIDPESVPSRGAVKMLKWVATSGMNYATFLNAIWTKTLPNRAQLDVEANFQDDGRVQLELLKAFEADLENPTTKKAKGK